MAATTSSAPPSSGKLQGRGRLRDSELVGKETVHLCEQGGGDA